MSQNQALTLAYHYRRSQMQLLRTSAVLCSTKSNGGAIEVGWRLARKSQIR